MQLIRATIGGRRCWLPLQKRATYWISAAELSSDNCTQVDLVVVGSVAVCSTGARIGKGEGFAELEYGILKWMGAIDDSTIVATTVHDEQVGAIICLKYINVVDLVVAGSRRRRVTSAQAARARCPGGSDLHANALHLDQH